MKQDEELWLKKMKEVLSDHHESPPPDGWQQLEKELAPPVVGKRIYHLKWWGVAATLLIGVCVASLLFLNSPVAEEIITVSGPLATVPDVIPEVREAEVTPVKTDPAINPVVAKAAVNTQRTSRTEPTIVLKDEPVIIDKTPTEQPGKDTPEEVKTVDVDDKVKTKGGERTVVKPSDKSKLHIPIAKAKTSRKKDWSVGVSVSNISSMEGSGDLSYIPSQDGPLSSMSLSDVSSGAIKISNEYVLDFKNGLPNFANDQELLEYDHRQPITVGLSLRKELAKGFSVETGVNYTMLSSEIKYQNGNNKEDQKLHYIGIPIRANWSFIDSKRFTVYVGAGGAVEKSVYGKRGTDNLKVKELQFSLTGALGAQFNATRNIGLYVEPGVAYFFDDGSNVETIRKESPFNFNLQAGLRFTY